jgi:FkbM family methyltransferase
LSCQRSLNPAPWRHQFKVEAVLSSLDRLAARGRKLLAVLRRPEYRRALLHGVVASVEHDAIPLRRDFATVIDVGANRGQFAIYAAAQFPGASLICFEPLPGARAGLRRVLAGNRRLTVFEYALSCDNGERELHVSAADDSSSLLPIGPRQREAFPGTGERSTVAVQVRRLDDVLETRVLEAPVLLKLDVQGSELAVLEGGERTLRLVQAVLVEVSFVELYTGQPLADQVFDRLRKLGFTCKGVWSLTYGAAGECLQGDFLFAGDGFEPLRA